MAPDTGRGPGERCPCAVRRQGRRGPRTRTLGLAWRATFALFGLAAGCADGDGECSPVIDACDIQDAECQQGLLEAMACLRGDRAPASVEVDRWSTETAREASAGAVESLSAEQRLLRARQFAALALFRLVPATWDPVESATDYADSVPAFYDAETETVVVVDDEPPDAGTTTPEPPDGGPPGGKPPIDEDSLRLMTHELTHALRDQATGLVNFYGRAGTTTDRFLVTRAIVEGEAQLYAELALLELHGEPLDARALQGTLSQAKRSAQLAFDAADNPFSLADRFLPYPYGFSYVLDAYDTGGKPGIERLFQTPPESTRELTSGFGAAEPFGGPWSEDAELARVAEPVLSDAYEPLGVLFLGAWLVDAFVQRALPEQTHDLSWAVLSALRSDALALFHRGDRDTPLAVWRMRFADVASAQAMLELATWPDSMHVRRDARDVIFVAAPASDEAAKFANVRFRALGTGEAAAMASAAALGGAGVPRSLAAAPPRGL